MTFNTGNPIGSTDARDLSDNAENFDKALGTTAATWVDRFGVTRDSFEGRLAKGSFYRVGDFTTGYTLTNMRQTLEYSGHEYSWAGTFPKVVAAGATPATSGGIGAGAWVDRTDLTLRGELNAYDGEKNIGICPDIATLRTIEPESDGQRITLKQHTSGTLLGGGQFRALLDGSVYTDDNGLIIKTTGGAAWLRINADIVNPLMYGAVADGVTGDQAALNAAGRSGARKIDLLGLTYAVGGTWFLDSSVSKFVYDGKLVYHADLGASPMMRFKNAPHEMHDVEFDGTLASTSGALIWEGASTGRGGRVKRCHFKALGGPAIGVSGNYSTLAFASYGSIEDCSFDRCGQLAPANLRCTIILEGVSNFSIDNVKMTGCNWGIYCRNDFNQAGVNRASGNRITNAIIRGSGRKHATFTDAQGISNSYQDGLYIDGVTVSDFADNAIDMQYCAASIVTNWRATFCKDGVFMGDRSCSRHVISNGIALNCDRAIRLITDGTLEAAAILKGITIENVHAYNPIYHGFQISRTGASTQMFDIKLVNCSVDAGNSYTLSTLTHGINLSGGTNVTITSFNSYDMRNAGIYVANSNIVQIDGGIHQNVDRVGSGNYAVDVESTSNRVRVSDVTVYGSGTAGAVILRGGSGHTAKHIRWRGTANGVNSSGATTPYLLDNVTY